jgi:hypothetical protein
MSFKVDYAFGTQKEIEVLDKIRVFFKDDTIKASSYKYSKHDFIGTSIYELKSRNCSTKAFNTTLLPKTKVIPDKENQVFLFNFTDGLYYINYNKNLFENVIECSNFKRHKRIDYNDKEQLYYHIPIDMLSRIN